MSAANSLARVMLWADVHDFFHQEADLLDSRRYGEWLQLLDETIKYRMPIARNVRREDADREYTGDNEAAWFDEGIETLRQRVAQIRTAIHWAEEPASRVCHMISNVRVMEALPSAAEPSQVAVSSRFLIYQNRHQTDVALFVGKRKDVLVRHGDSWKIAQRTVYLDQSVLLAKALTTFF
ncbi:MAG: hypothetical protein V7642_2779 [Burkholderiales bacterium]|jgi:3-phenylpropionate/cinnamic acid dioxygenase small subunit